MKTSPRKLDKILGDEIGRGGYGVVYVRKDDTSSCIKVSNKAASNDSCRKWSNEYKKICAISKSIRDDGAYTNLKMVRLLEPSDFVETASNCYMVMPRVFRPEGRDVMKPTVQAQMGVESVRMTHKGRGEFIGLSELREYVSEEDLMIAARELGLLMGLIHFRSRNDAYDIEVYFGKEARSKKGRFYIADFDLSEQIEGEYSNEVIERICWSLDAVPYFPTDKVDRGLFEAFKSAYASVAGNDELVEKIFENYG